MVSTVLQTSSFTKVPYHPFVHRQLSRQCPNLTTALNSVPGHNVRRVQQPLELLPLDVERHGDGGVGGKVEEGVGDLLHLGRALHQDSQKDGH